MKAAYAIEIQILNKFVSSLCYISLFNILLRSLIFIYPYLVDNLLFL